MNNKQLRENTEDTYALQLAGGPQWQRIAQEWLENFESARTRATYAAAWRNFLQWLGGPLMDPATVTRLDVIRYRDTLAQAGTSGATIGVRIAALASFFEYAKSQGALKANPVEGVKRPKVEAFRAAKWLNAKEAAALLRGPDRDTLEGLRDYAILLAMLTMGLRRAEVIGITRGSILSSGERVELRYSPKGGEDRTRPVPAQVWRAIREYMDARGPLEEDAPVFVAHDRAADVRGHAQAEAEPGHALTGEALRNMIAKYSRRELGRVINPHALRHTCAGTAWDSTKDLRRVQNLLGHASATTTEKYLHRRDDDRGELGEALATIYEAS